jgi:hypothetical protein
VKPDGSVPTVLEAFKYEDGRLVCLFNSAKHSVGDIVGSSQEEGYVRIRYAQKTYLVHRLIWEMRNGGIPPDREIDHINGDAQDNRIENLRLVTRKENARNIGLQRRNRTGVSGVSVSNGLYRVTIGAEFVGHFDTLSEATRVRKDAEKRLGYHENHGRKRQ